MRSVRFLLIVVTIVMFAVTSLPVQAKGEVPDPVGLRTDAPDYAKHGPFWVGTRELTIPDKDGKRPLPLTVWYPALNPKGSPEDVTYSYDNFATLQGFTQPGHALKDAAVDASKGPYPLVIVSHGFVSYRYAFAYLAEHLASRGFVVMAVDHTGNTLAYVADPKLASGVAQSFADSFVSRPSDIQRQIDYAHVLAGKGGVLDGTIDIARIAVVGHSLGGYTALASAGAQVNLGPLRAWCSANANDKTATDSPRYFLLCGILVPAEQRLLTENDINAKLGEMWPPFKVSGVSAIVPMSPADVFAPESFTRVTIPTLLIVGTNDMFGFYKPTDSAYEKLPSTQKAMIAFENADHFFPAGECPPWFEEHQLGGNCGPEPVWNLDRAHDLTNHFTTAFLLDVLKGDKEAHKALLPDAVQFAGIQYKTTMK